jgi:ABC-type transport system substrate-binding protein
VLLGLLAVAARPAAQGSTEAQAGGIFRVSFQGSSSLQAFDHIDPALAYSRESWTLLDTVCARLMRYRDAPPPRGYELVPEVAAARPSFSRDGRTWTFRLRTGFRFSDGRPVRADAFAQAIRRAKARGVDSHARLYTQAIAGVTARENTLVVRFNREVRDFDAWTTMPFFCAVPPTLPPDREGVRSFPGAGPYYVREYRPNQRIVIRRNPYYGGNRAHHVEGFDVDLTADSPEEVLDRVEAGKADWGYTPPAPAVASSRGLIGKFGLNYSRFHITPGLGMWLFVLNSSRPLFKANPKLRQAVNLALNRFEFRLRNAEEVTDQLVPPLVLGIPNHEIYPPEGDLERAVQLAAGNLRGGKAILYVPESRQKGGAAQLCAEQLKAIGLDVDIRPIAGFVTTSAYRGRLGNADEPWDIALVLWNPDFVDPSSYVNLLLDAESAGGTNLARFDETPFIERMRRADRLRGAARKSAYARLDLELGRDAAPAVPMGVLNEATLVSARVDTKKCMLLRPSLVLTTVCLNR